jgi:hypothetical protein
MNCAQIDERLLAVTAAGPPPAFDAAELAHLGACPRCRERAESAAAVFAGLAGAPRAASPGPEYWGSVVPRLRQRLESGSPGAPRRWDIAVRTAVMPAAAAVVIAIVLATGALRTPGTPGTEGSAGSEALAMLSDAELHELRLAGTATGLLDAAETNGGAEWTIADFLLDLASEEGDAVLYAVAEPEDLLAVVDDAEFAEIVSLLDQQ